MRRGNGALAAGFADFGTDNFPFQIQFQKRFKIVVFPFWRRDPGWELQVPAICGADVSSLIVFRNSVCADRSGMAASRFVVPAAACVILLHFAAESRESH